MKTTLALQPHPTTPCTFITAIDVVAEATTEAIRCTYVVHGAIDRLAIPVRAGMPARTAGLWQRTCFEVFLMPPGAPGYSEFNFSPSGDWAAYAFRSYREGMMDLEVDPPPLISWEQTADRCCLDAAVRIAGAVSPKIAISVVLLDLDGHRHYWALRHPPGKPDFHDARAFTAL